MDIRQHLLAGQAIPAHPLALDAGRRFSERHQRALTRYYLASGVGGLAVAVHSTQFEIREPRHGLLRPVLELAAETAAATLAHAPRPVALIAGVCGPTSQAVAEATQARALGYHAVLVSMAALNAAPTAVVVDHLRAVAEILPIIGFYLQPVVGGRVFDVGFWRAVLEIENVVAIKIAPFNRYQTLDVVRAAVETGRDDVALYTGNDDAIVADLLTPFTFTRQGRRHIVGGLLGHWGVWTQAAVQLFRQIRGADPHQRNPADWWELAAAVTDMNAAVFDAAHRFAGCIPGILEVLRRQGLVPTNHCLNPDETLSPGQAAELTRVTAAYPALVDDAFVAAHRDEWLR
ncbi:dihydrodipicolinate synthase family protein [Opitutus terrae]|uniref:Dihydrodipicolinate synthetase n=1 Tax=Opitutus terrae (strain DSM 11246 / JCM 15787 / PB90-1) TaxID=452637 RepID=B1ZY52_OPITP|nr:dihydrodipicolinate synthase family protein [Opitutus terrae]ACB76201.1 dihydrodipicolinate synthetase [Opitutus terrae PB90-1]